MKIFIFIIVTVLLLKPALPFLEYVVNYDYITQVLCENKATPELECNGKCHLMKELAKASEVEKPLSSQKKSVVGFEIMFFQKIQEFTVLTPNSTYLVVSNYYFDNYTYLVLDTPFRPPTVA
ncbi:hypothetical protein [Flavobacterium ardleyense]|uniref:hypothetical protein n=1 Tax=Flavobacterium ardleyense TaxID=2038737 RepID=UPI00298D4C5E|nr:hypothetical protein [Flavobacterium ardleyense]